MRTDEFHIASVVLMAGYSRRMGHLKQHVMLNGKTFLDYIIEKLQIFPNEIITKIFVGQERDKLGQQKVKNCSGIWISNLNPDDGPISSIRLALDEITSSVDAIMLWPTDHPMIEYKTLEKLIASFNKKPDFITLPSDGTHRGHPAIFPKWCFDYFKHQELNNGAKTLLQIFPDKINYVLTDDIWITRNINTPELLHEAERLLSINVITDNR